MAFRRRRFRRTFNGRRGGGRRQSKFEISQGYQLVNFSVIPTSTFNAPDKFAFHLFSQFGLSRTSEGPGGVQSLVVLDSSVRSISVAWLQVRLALQHVPQVAGTAPRIQINYLPVHISCYKDDIAPSQTNFINTLSVIPNHFTLYNPFMVEVGSPLAPIDPNFGAQRGGAVSEVFGSPDRIMHREHWLQPVCFTDTTISDESFWAMNNVPGLGQRRTFTVKKIRLEDAAAIWFEISSVGTGIPSDVNANLPFAIEWIVCYRVNR